MKRTQFYSIRHRYPSIGRLGLAVEYFPRYVHREENLHAVDVVLLSVILKGRGQHLLDQDRRPVKGSSIDITHYGQKQDIVTDARGMEIYNVYLDLRNHPLPVLPPSLRGTLSAILPLHDRLAHQLNRRVSIRLDEVDRMAASLRRIEQESCSEALGAEEVVRHSFQIFLIDLCRAAQRHGLIPSLKDGRAFPAWLEQLRLRLDAHFADPYGLDLLANEAGVSVTYLCRLFKAYTGKTIVGYLVERRIQAAIWKLREDDTKVLSIALACGFNDLAYFNRVFKRIVGMTPSAYRKKTVSKKKRDSKPD